MTKKRSTLRKPTWELRGNKQKCHPIKLKFIITSDTLIASLVSMMYHNTFGDEDKPEYYYFKDQKEIPIEDITLSEIEDELKWNLRYKGEDFFENQMDKKDNHVWDKAKQVIMFKYPMYFNNNTLNFIME